MKIFHIADLHLGKRVNEFDMLPAQSNILDTIINEIKTHKPQAIILAGDIYDRSVPGSDAVKLFDHFLSELQACKINIYIIAGNHDSKERLSFASSILESSNIYIAANIEKTPFKHDLNKDITIHMVPFLRPTDVRAIFDNDDKSYDAAFKTVIDQIDINPEKFNILVAHQFFTSGSTEPEKSESEIVNVGGIDNIDTSHLDAFDYVALGHIHRPQRIGKDHIRYAGSILKYSLSEVHHTKSITVLDIDNKELTLSTIPLIPSQDMVHIKGYLEAILSSTDYKRDDFTFITLLDEDELVDALARLRDKFPYLMNIRFENKRMAFDNDASLSYESLNEMNPLNLFNDFYLRQNNQELTDKQKDFVQNIMEALYETD